MDIILIYISFVLLYISFWILQFKRLKKQVNNVTLVIDETKDSIMDIPLIKIKQNLHPGNPEFDRSKKRKIRIFV